MWEKITDNILTITIIVGIIFLLLFLNQSNSTNKLKSELKRQEQVSKQNMAALNDSIKVYKNKIGQLTYSKPIADMSAKDIEKYFPDLYVRLKNELGEVKIIWKTEIEYVDTGSVVNSVIKLKNNQYALGYNYYSKDSLLHIKSTNTFFADLVLMETEDNVDKYSITMQPGISTIDEMSLKLGFTTGIKKEGSLYKIFITPDNKNITVNHIEGADVSNIINPPTPSTKYKKWSIGPYIGFGAYINSTNKSVQLGPEAGIGLQYTLFRF
jgi:hypothetical protein